MNGRVVRRGKSWQGIIYVGSKVVDGKRVPIRETFTRPTRAEAVAEWTRRLNILIESPDMLLSDWLDEWLKSRKLAPASVAAYTSVIERHLKPFFAGEQIGSITPRRIEAYYASKTLSPTYLVQHHAILKRAFKDAVIRGILLESPVPKVESPKRDCVEMNIVGPAQMQNIIQRCNSTLYLSVLLACTTGTRIGEICGLKWADIDSDFLVVRRIRWRGQFKSPKTRSSV